jgi:ATP-dependent protease ClpP protease subunit
VDGLDKAVIHSTEKFYENQALDLQEEMREYNDEEETLQDNYAEQEELTIV